MTHIALVCVGNADRSRMMTAFTVQERDERGLDDHVKIVTGGIDPHGYVHDVIEALREKGLDGRSNHRTSNRLKERYE